MNLQVFMFLRICPKLHCSEFQFRVLSVKYVLWGETCKYKAHVPGMARCVRGMSHSSSGRDDIQSAQLSSMSSESLFVFGFLN